MTATHGATNKGKVGSMTILGLQKWFAAYLASILILQPAQTIQNSVSEQTKHIDINIRFDIKIHNDHCSPYTCNC